MSVKAYPSELSAEAGGGRSKKRRVARGVKRLWDATAGGDPSGDVIGRGAEGALRGVEARSHSIQVGADHYGASYLNLPRMVTYWYQADAVRRCGGRQVLEVGVGMGLTAWILRSWGYSLATLDLDAALGPTCVGDVTSMPFCDGAFETILIAEVLEHLPFAAFGGALRELGRVTRRNVIVTLPCPLVGFSVGINICGISPRFFSLGGRQWTRPVFDGQHYWELGRRGYSKRRIRKAIREAGFEIVREFRPGLSLYNYFFVLRKRSAG